jgi:hypothetical protein
MIYNLKQYLDDEFPSEVIYTNDAIATIAQEFIPDRYSIVSEEGGTETAWGRFIAQLVQVKSVDADGPGARQLAHLIYEKITSVFGLVLPEVTVKGILYQSVQIAQISANAPPYNLGADIQGRIVYSTNFTVYYSRGV